MRRLERRRTAGHQDIQDLRILHKTNTSITAAVQSCSPRRRHLSYWAKGSTPKAKHSNWSLKCFLTLALNSLVGDTQPTGGTGNSPCGGPVLLQEWMRNLLTHQKEAQAASGKTVVRTRSVHGCELRVYKLGNSHVRFDTFSHSYTIHG